jgi:hypothetical protein
MVSVYKVGSFFKKKFKKKSMENLTLDDIALILGINMDVGK